MGIEVKNLVMIAVDLMDVVDTEDDSFYDDLDKYSTFKSGEISYLHDGMSGEYLYVGECLSYEDDVFSGGAFELDLSNVEVIKQKVYDFIKSKYGKSLTPKVVVINHVY